VAVPTDKPRSIPEILLPLVQTQPKMMPESLLVSGPAVFDPQSAQTQPLPVDFAITPSPDSLRATVRIVVPAEESASPTAPASETVTSPVKTEAV